MLLEGCLHADVPVWRNIVCRTEDPLPFLGNAGKTTDRAMLVNLPRQFLGPESFTPGYLDEAVVHLQAQLSIQGALAVED